jgi:superfamily II DNA/RNA helicase
MSLVKNIETYDNVENYSTFSDMGLKPNLLKGLFSYGFEKPSNIQQKAIMPFVKGNDLIAQSQSGTGKTATFSIGVLQNINESNNFAQAIILAPTRELAKQIYEVVNELSKFTKIKTKLIIGGRRHSKYTYQNLDENCHLIIGTPGRISDNLEKGRISNENLRMLVLDEADEMLSMGFRNQITMIFNKMPEKRQMGFFSATMPKEMLDITHMFMKHPKKILIKNEDLTLEGIKQFYIALEHENDKYDCMVDLYSTISVTMAIIYCNSKKKVEWLSDLMREQNFEISCITGDMTEDERNHVMKQFRNGVTRVLITTDLLSRGIDVQQISLVLNYDIPFEKETYIHRIGRSGRYGRKGVAINFVTGKDYKQFKDIESFYDTKIDELPENIAEYI